MRLSPRIAFHGIPPTEWLEADIRKRAQKLGACCAYLLSCRIVVDIPHHDHGAGNRFSLRIELTAPGEQIAVTRGSNLHAFAQVVGAERWTKRAEIESERQDVGVVVRDAFDAARRRLQNYTRRHRRRATRVDSQRPTLVYSGERECRT